MLMAAAAVAAGIGGGAIAASPPQPPLSSGAQMRFVGSRKEMAGLDPVAFAAWLTEPGREGLFLWRAGDQRAAIEADRLQGLSIAAEGDPAGATGCWVRQWDGIVGRPEWFGAITGDPAQDCRPALEACARLCQTVRLGPHDYYIHDSWQMGISGRNIVGSAGSGSTVGLGYDAQRPIGTADGTRVILTGAKVIGAAIFIFGGNASPKDDDRVMRNSHVCDIKFARDCSRFKVRPGLSDDPESCVKGVILSFFSDCSVSGLRSYDSPIGYHCYGIVYSLIRNCMARRVTPASSRRRDFWVGWLVGGYGDANFGYIGASASVYFEHCSVFDNNPAFDLSIGLKLYGRIADSFLYRFEMARLDYGMVIDGSDERGVKMGNSEYFLAHQDVTIVNPVLDGYSRGGFLIRNLQDFNCLDIVTPYSSGAGFAIDVADAAGTITISGGKLLTGGVRVRNVNGFRLTGTLIRDAPVPLQFINVGMFRAEPNILNLSPAIPAGCVLERAFRGLLAPQIRGAPGTIGVGVTIDAASDHVTVDETAIDPGCFVSVDPRNKVRYAGKDAHLGAGTNLITGTRG